MARSINIGYHLPNESVRKVIELDNPYYNFGTQKSSETFWSLPIWKEIGVNKLSELGHTDPIFFIGWEELEELSVDMQRYRVNIARIEYEPVIKVRLLAHLTYCYSLLISTAPFESIPFLAIG